MNDPNEVRSLRSLLTQDDFVDSISTGFVVFGKDDEVLDCNLSAVQLLGITRKQLIGHEHRKYLQVIDEDGSPLQGDKQPWRRASRTGVQSRRAVVGVVIPGAPPRWLTVDSFPINVDGETVGAMSTFSDYTTTRKQQHFLRMQTEVMRVVVSASDELTSLRQLCDALVKYGPYRLAWVGVPSTSEEFGIDALCASGATDYIFAGMTSWSEASDKGRGPSGIAMRTGETQLVNNFYKDAQMGPWQRRAEEFGLSSGIVIPLRIHGDRAVIHIYDQYKFAFDEVAIRGLEDIVRESAFGVEHVRAVNALEVALRETTDVILEAAPDSILIVDSDLVILKTSPGSQKIFGRPGDDRLGHGLGELVHLDDQPRFVAALRELFDRHDGELANLRFRARHADGHWLTIEMRGRLLADVEGLGQRALLVSRDITETVRAQSALEENLQVMRAILNTAADEIVLINRDLNVLEISPGTERIFGVERADRRGHEVSSIVHPDDRSIDVAELNRLFEGGPDLLVKYRLRALHSDGHEMMIETLGRLVDDTSGRQPRAVLVTRDISETVVLERAMESARAEAERANLAKSEFLSRMSHELRTPLNAVLGFAQILEMELVQPSSLEALHIISTSGKHLLDLVNEILDLSLVESGTIAVSLEVVALERLTNECVGIVAPQAEALGIDVVRSDFDGNYVLADPQRLKQVLINLLSNAIKYNRPGGAVTLACRRTGGGKLRISVDDTGVGIAPEKIERLFTPFDRLDAESTRVEGIGLGLALSKGLAVAMGATLDVESTPGVGSSFWIDLPVGVSEEPTAT